MKHDAEQVIITKDSEFIVIVNPVDDDSDDDEYQSSTSHEK